MRANSWLLAAVAVVTLGGCAHRYTPPPPLPAPPRPLPAPGDEDPAASRATEARALASLQLGFEDCRTLGRRIEPRLAGRAVLAARIDRTGYVSAASALRVDALPAPVVACLVNRVQATRFPARPAPTDVLIPVDLTRRVQSPAPPATAPTGTFQL